MDHPAWRIPQPTTNQGREMAEEVWKRRHTMPVETKADEPGMARVTLNPALTLRIVDRTHIQFAMATREEWRAGGECSVQYQHFCHITSDDRARWTVHAWRAAQAARLLRALGEDADAGDAPLAVPTREPQGRIARLAMRLAPARVATTAEILERALDDAVLRRVEALSPSDPATDRLDIGNGVCIDASTWAPILAVHHADHGTFSLPGRAARAFNARIDTLREAAMAGMAAPGDRIDRVMAICREAVALDPDMTDDAGTPIAPLVAVHLPRLAERRREALASSTRGDQADLDREIEETLTLVADAVGRGMATRARTGRDALRTELRFLSARHPSEPEAR